MIVVVVAGVPERELDLERWISPSYPSYNRKINPERAEIHIIVDNFCGKKVFVCKTRKC